MFNYCIGHFPGPPLGLEAQEHNTCKLQPDGNISRYFDLSSKKKKIWKILLIALCLTGAIVAWLGFGERGLIRLYHTEMERQAFIERIRRLDEENKALLKEVQRFRTDMEYVESVVRRELNLIKKNEIIYRFKNEAQRRNPGTDILQETARNDKK